MRKYATPTVDAYISSSIIEARSILIGLRKIIKTTIPEVEEKISWGIPFYRFNGQLAGYAVFKNHVSFGLGGHNLPTQIRKTLDKKGYKTGKKTIQIGFNQKIPEAEIRKLLKIYAQLKRYKRRKRKSKQMVSHLW